MPPLEDIPHALQSQSEEYEDLLCNLAKLNKDAQQRRRVQRVRNGVLIVAGLLLASFVMGYVWFLRTENWPPDVWPAFLHRYR